MLLRKTRKLLPDRGSRSSNLRLAPSAPTGMERRQRSGRGGFTLIEVLLATAATLLMMISLAQIFKMVGDNMRQGRAALELNNRLRSVAFRLRKDLENATVDPKLPAGSALGYLKYYDGSLTDYSMLANSGTENLSRFGDVDDILMFTARAGDVWFTGKVPLFVLRGGPSGLDDDTEMVTIAAQHAEVVLFAEPVVSNQGNPTRSQNPLIANPGNFEPVPGTSIPAGYRLYYRTLLIRPDLNNGGVLPTMTVDDQDYLIAQQTFVQLDGNNIALPTPTCDMTKAHFQCDLSMRRVNPLSPTSRVAANSLEDLANPANRFAHVQIPLPQGVISMPILALSTKMNVTSTALDAGAPHSTSGSTNPLHYQSGFLHPAFTLVGDRSGEDILATDVLAFDVKAFDTGAPVIATYGNDGTPGTDGGDETIGAAGSDDLLLTPNDPLFVDAVAAVGNTAQVVGQGAYVDIGWGWKHYVQSGGNPNVLANSLMQGQLGAIAMSASPGAPFPRPLYKSGLALHSGNVGTGNLPLIFQPAYDSWTSRYEGDGLLQTEVSGARGVVQFTDTSGSGPDVNASESWRQPSPNAYVIDAGTDGLDNPGSAAGVDDASELETSPPFPAPIRGIKVSIRMEDPATRQIKQMSVAREFVTQ